LPKSGSAGDTAQEKIDVAFRVIADHIRTLSFAIADGIQPGNTERSYVLRRILRRAVRYGRTLGFNNPFFHKLVDVLGNTMGGVFSEIRERQKHVEEVIRVEEEAFNKTLDSGMKVFEDVVKLEQGLTALVDASRQAVESVRKVQAEVTRSGQRFCEFSMLAKLGVLSRFMASRAISFMRIAQHRLMEAVKLRRRGRIDFVRRPFGHVGSNFLIQAWRMSIIPWNCRVWMQWFQQWR
jgi:hypothetical protein